MKTDNAKEEIEEYVETITETLNGLAKHLEILNKISPGNIVYFGNAHVINPYPEKEIITNGVFLEISDRDVNLSTVCGKYSLEIPYERNWKYASIREIKNQKVIKSSSSFRPQMWEPHHICPHTEILSDEDKINEMLQEYGLTVNDIRNIESYQRFDRKE